MENKIILEIPCPKCEKLTPVTGTLVGDKLKDEIVEATCGHCGAKLNVNLVDAREMVEAEDKEPEAEVSEPVREHTPVEDAIFTIGVENFGHKKEARYILTGYRSVVEAMGGVMDALCLMLFTNEYQPPVLKDLYIKSQISTMYSPAQMRDLSARISKLADEIEAANERTKVLQGDISKI